MNRPPEQRGHPTTQADLAQAQQVVVDHVQKLEKQPGPRSDTRQKELDAAKAALARLAPPEGPSTSTHSSSGSQPAGTSATTNGDTPPTGIDSGAPPEGSRSRGEPSATTATTAPGGGKAPQVGYGKLIPENTTHPEHLDLARRRAENLEKIAAKRNLNPHEQEIYENARRIRDRYNPLPSGTRDTGNPRDLVMAGGDGTSGQTHGAAAEMPPVAHVQAPNAVGTAIEGTGTTNPDAPRASASDGSGNSGTPSVPDPQQPVPPHGPSSMNGGASGNSQPPLEPTKSPQGSAAPSLTPPDSKPQGPQLPFAPSPYLEWHVSHDTTRHLLPDKPFDSSRKPTKPEKVLSKNDTDQGNIRGRDGENETARVLAKHGRACW